METSFESIPLALEKTSLEGKLLGTVKPIWVKVGKREQCLGWMETMHRRGLCVKKLEDYAKVKSVHLRTEEMKL